MIIGKDVKLSWLVKKEHLFQIINFSKKLHFFEINTIYASFNANKYFFKNMS